MSRFVALLARLERELDVPYPARAELIAEIAADLDAAFEAGVARGLFAEAAEALAIAAARLDHAALEDVHRTAVGRLLHRLAPRARAVAGWSGAALPLAVMLVYFALEVPVLELLRLGGFAVYPILVVGCLGLVAALRRAFLWGVVKDHRPETLALDDHTPLHLALATVVAGVAGTATGVYKTLSVADADGALIAMGVKESLTCVILAGALATLTILAHAAARMLLRRTGVARVG